MSNYTSHQCSCIICKKLTSSKGIHSHYLIVHTDQGATQNRKNRLSGSLRGAAAVKQNARAVQNQYLESPNTCIQCNSPLIYKQRHNKFCSKSCSAVYHNSSRKGKPITELTKQKIAYKVNQYNYENPYPAYSKISFCCICISVIKHKCVKTCSAECKSQLLSHNISERIKTTRKSNYTRSKRSYLETSFESWMVKNNINVIYETEYTIKNHITNKWYFVDFYFPSINLIVELDGRQHETPKHKQADKIRDEYIKTYLNINVFRISYDEYKSGVKIPKLLSLLSTCEAPW